MQRQHPSRLRSNPSSLLWKTRLIAQIKLLAQAQQKMTEPPETPTLGSTTVELLKTPSDKITESIETIVKAATMFHQLPRVADWLEWQILNLERRNLWLDIIGKLAGMMGSAYLAFFIARRLLKHLCDVLQHYPAQRLTMRILYLFALLLLALMPIILFVIVGYIAMGLIQPTENIRLIAITWINAAVIVHIAVSVMRFLFAPQYPQLRLLPVSDETSLTIDSWTRWLSMIMTYGYFGLQAALLIGMPLPLYETLLRLLGLLVTGLIVLMILQNRRSVAQFIRGRETLNARKLHPRQILRQFASAWHIVAIIYVLMLYGVWALALTGGFFFILKGTLLTVLILMAGNAMAWFIENGFRRKFQIGEAWRRRYPGLESRFNRYWADFANGSQGSGLCVDHIVRASGLEHPCLRLDHNRHRKNIQHGDHESRRHYPDNPPDLGGCHAFDGKLSGYGSRKRPNSLTRVSEHCSPLLEMHYFSF